MPSISRLFPGLIPGLILVTALMATAVQADSAPAVAPEILGELPHDEGVFTQGLFLHQGLLYQSAGLRGQSRLLVTEPKSGTRIAVHWLLPFLFAEGADLCGDEVVQLTWTSGLALRYEPLHEPQYEPERADSERLRRVGEFRYRGQGWGIACDGDRVVTSDGSATLTFRDPKTFKPRRQILVTDDGHPITQLNELEWVDGLLLANVWKTDRIAVIDPTTGKIRVWLDMSEAVRRSGQTGPQFVLNGIAWDAVQQRLYVTGKNWPRIYLVEWPGTDELKQGR